MSIYIKGFEVPKIEVMNGISLCLFKSYGGDIRIRNNETGEVFNVFPVPSHGRLGDLDELYKEALKRSETKDGYYNCLYPVISCYTIDHAPTIIEAEEGET